VFGNLGWGEVLVLLVIGLVVLGPERLPGAIRWTTGALRQAREYLHNASAQIREDLGPEFDDLAQPLGELNKLRGMSPRAAITKHLLDGDDSIFTGNFGDPAAPSGPSPAVPPVAPAAPEITPGPVAPAAGPAAGAPESGSAAPRFDPDAT
jgi:sec-independent protein translocase protein TatB